MWNYANTKDWKWWRRFYVIIFFWFSMRHHTHSFHLISVTFRWQFILFYFISILWKLNNAKRSQCIWKRKKKQIVPIQEFSFFDTGKLRSAFLLSFVICVVQCDSISQIISIVLCRRVVKRCKVTFFFKKWTPFLAIAMPIQMTDNRLSTLTFTDQMTHQRSSTHTKHWFFGNIFSRQAFSSSLMSLYANCILFSLLLYMSKSPIHLNTAIKYKIFFPHPTQNTQNVVW